LIFHFKRFKQTHKTSMMFTSFYDLKKWVESCDHSGKYADEEGWMTLCHSQRYLTWHLIWLRIGTITRWLTLPKGLAHHIWIGIHRIKDIT
jgi:hypothetical protein